MSKKAEGKTGENGKLQDLAKVALKAKDFLSQHYVWLSLTVGFLWMLSIPIIITVLQGIWDEHIQEFSWIFQVTFFPFTLSLLVFTGVTVDGDWVVMYTFSFVISMLFCLSIAYVIHRVRTRIKRHVK